MLIFHQGNIKENKYNYIYYINITMLYNKGNICLIAVWNLPERDNIKKVHHM